MTAPGATPRSGASGPELHRAITKYRDLARTYDRQVARSSRPLREHAIERLELRKGNVVLDIGCGTGLSFAPLEARIGPQGGVVGIDLSPDMLAVARDRIDCQGWSNIALFEASAERARLPVEADAALFVLTGDLMRSAEALRTVLGHLRPGGRVAAAGVKWATPVWAAPINLVRRQRSRRYATTFDGRKRPWDLLGRLVSDLCVEATPLGRTYVAWGTVPQRRRADRT